MNKWFPVLALLLSSTFSHSQGQLTFEPDRNVPPSEQYLERSPSNDPETEAKEETNAERSQRINDRFGDSGAAIKLVEDAEKNRDHLEAELVRDKLSEAKDALNKVKSSGISEKKRNQLAAAWGRLAKSERFLFGDTDNNLEWLRNAYDLDPDNEDIARALDVAERKQSYAFAQLEEAAKVRAQREQQN